VHGLVDQAEGDLCRLLPFRLLWPARTLASPVHPFGHQSSDRPFIHLGLALAPDVTALMPPTQKSSDIAGHARPVMSQDTSPRVVGGVFRVEIEGADPVNVGGDVVAIDNHVQAVVGRLFPERDLAAMKTRPSFVSRRKRSLCSSIRSRSRAPAGVITSRSGLITSRSGRAAEPRPPGLVGWLAPLPH
jgi:hypothetical protein